MLITKPLSIDSTADRSKIRTSVIVLVFNGLSHLPELVDSLKNQTDKNFELIFIDNASTDGSCEWIENNCPESRLFRMTYNAGFCAGMNRGAEIAYGHNILLLNQDLKLDNHSIESLSDALDAAPDHIAGVFPMVRFYHVPHFINAMGANWYETCQWRDTRVGLCDMGQFQANEEVFGSIFPAVMFKRNRFFEIGRFDESFWSYDEDFDICYRANVFGYRFLTVPAAIMFHKYRASSTDTTDPLKSKYWFLRNYFLVFLKNYSLNNLRTYGRLLFMRYIGHSLQHAWKTKNYSEVRLYLRVLLGILCLAPHIIKKRRGIQRHRKLPDSDIWRTGPIEEHNLYHVDGCIVLSLKSLYAATQSEHYDYDVDGKSFKSV